MFFVKFFYYLNLSMCSIKLFIDVNKETYIFSVPRNDLTVGYIKKK